MQAAYLLYERFTALNIVGPYDVLNRVPGTDSVLEVVAPDIVVGPGGFGTRTLLEHEPVYSESRSKRAMPRSRA